MEVNFSLKYVFSYLSQIFNQQPTIIFDGYGSCTTKNHEYFRIRSTPYLKAHSFESLEIIKFYLRKIDISL